MDRKITAMMPMVDIWVLVALLFVVDGVSVVVVVWILACEYKQCKLCFIFGMPINYLVCVEYVVWIENDFHFVLYAMYWKPQCTTNTCITWPFKLIIVISNTNTNRSYKESSSITTTSSKSRDELTTKSKGMSSLIDCSHLKRIKHGTVVVGTGWPFWLLLYYT